MKKVQEPLPQSAIENNRPNRGTTLPYPSINEVPLNDAFPEAVKSESTYWVII